MAMSQMITSKNPMKAASGRTPREIMITRRVPRLTSARRAKKMRQGSTTQLNAGEVRNSGSQGELRMSAITLFPPSLRKSVQRRLHRPDGERPHVHGRPHHQPSLLLRPALGRPEPEPALLVRGAVDPLGGAPGLVRHAAGEEEAGQRVGDAGPALEGVGALVDAVD